MLLIYYQMVSIMYLMTQKIREQIAELRLFLNKNFFTVLGGYFVFATIFALLSLLLYHIKILVRLDVFIQESIIGLRVNFLNDLFIIITNLGDTRSMIAWTFVTALIFFWKRHYLYSIGIILSLGASEFIAFILKDTIERHRPPSVMALVSETSASFPSGHSIAAISFYGFLIYFFAKKTSNSSTKKILISICAAIIVLSGFIRVYLGVHWPSDVIASYVLGLTWLLLVIRLINTREKQTGLENKAL